MVVIIILVLILIISFILALRSMRDFSVPREVRELMKINKVKGTILFFKKQIKHYKG